MLGVVVFLEPPMIPKHLHNLWKAPLDDLDVKISIHYLPKAKQASFAFNTKTTPGHNLRPVFRHSANLPSTLMPALYRVPEELEGCLVRKQSLAPVVTKVSAGPFHSSFLMPGG